MSVYLLVVSLFLILSVCSASLFSIIFCFTCATSISFAGIAVSVFLISADITLYSVCSIGRSPSSFSFSVSRVKISACNVKSFASTSEKSSFVEHDDSSCQHDNRQDMIHCL